MQKEDIIILYTDGGSRGNPGPAAIGVFIKMNDGGERKYGEVIGNRTNNEAEYEALIFGLKKIRQLVGKEKTENMVVEVRTDSELMYSHLNGKYKIKEPTLKNLFIEVWNIKQDFKNVIFKHIPREENKVADQCVNEALDSGGAQKGML
ncbi:MAG: hypothetical protein A2586_02090 [Candidatus Harrisonbacteria bacterium RIFOXYD1_FULL_40_9]|uniref:RNase H type-1 domain-containing protein n=2 Tax=Candidatus Harrisoniibacteriota TaxID=1817905 RepID=A0A1G1ZUU7_9BACT|nr:MAG: hypothetical protein A2586_02090 [Candidatus Harrisonbacteria bacterium RIFOXYD1_FULL_40_9]